jgi:hypothetical protein
VFLSCVFINFIFVFLTSGQDCNSGMQKRIHFRTDMEHNICRPVNNSDVSLGYQFCKKKHHFYFIYNNNVRYNNINYLKNPTNFLLVIRGLHQIFTNIHITIYEMKMLKTNLVQTSHLWNNLNQVCSKSND